MYVLTVSTYTVKTITNKDVSHLVVTVSTCIWYWRFCTLYQVSTSLSVFNSTFAITCFDSVDIFRWIPFWIEDWFHIFHPVLMLYYWKDMNLVSTVSTWSFESILDWGLSTIGKTWPWPCWHAFQILDEPCINSLDKNSIQCIVCFDLRINSVDKQDTILNTQ